jgi:polysaccharide biosynthesis PFTS motif protein
METPIITAMVRWGSLREVMFTNSAASRQPMWMRDGTVPTSMIWYSENSKWIWQVGDLDGDLPIYHHLAANEHWVWSQGHANWLRALGHSGPVHVVGPILWYLSDRPDPVRTFATAWITVFDIIPVTADRAVSIGLVDNFYSADRCIEFLRGIVEAVARVRQGCNLDIRVRIKPKRIQPHMDRAYADVLDALVKDGTIELMDPRADLFDLVRSSAISIVQPFSSPALVAAHMNARACYFDATAILPVPEHLDPAIMFVQDVASLERVIRDAVLSNAADCPATIPA